MKTNELRLGNYILIDWIIYKEERKVTEICPDGVFAKTKYSNIPEIVFIKEEDIEPIELTEKFLYKIGFCFGGVSGYGKHYVKTNGNDTLWCKIYENGDMSLTCNNNENLIQLHKVKFLHQLQNAYYCLTGQELEVEL